VSADQPDEVKDAERGKTIVEAPKAAAAHGGLDVTLFFWLLLVATIVAMLGRRIKVPYALALVLTGLVIGAPRLLPHAHLNPHTLFTVFLPPLLFEAAINLRIDAVRRSGWPIVVYALGGTVLSTCVVGGLAAWLFQLPLPVGLAFGALLSPTDPISVLAVFKSLGVGPRLSMIVEAESLFNDGVAVVLFTVLLTAAQGGEIAVVEGLQQFLAVVVGGAAVGVGIGAVASRVTRAFDDHLLEIMLTTVVAFGAYLFAETIHVSGVIAVVAAGLVVGNYGIPTGMSPTTRLAVASFWEYAAFVVNSIVFLLIGIEVTVINLWANIGMVLKAIGIVLAGRAAAVYGLSPLVNAFRGDVPFRWQHALFWGGLRGALSMALALGLVADFPHRATLVFLTFGVVVFSLLVQGLTIGPLLKWLGLAGRETKSRQYHRLSGERLASQAAVREMERLYTCGALVRPVCEQIVQEYQARLGELEAKIEELHLGDRALQAERANEARRLALVAEKSALWEAMRNGLIDDEDLRELMERIDHQLMTLEVEPSWAATSKDMVDAEEDAPE
jgi:Na+:H+ antiporter